MIRTPADVGLLVRDRRKFLRLSVREAAQRGGISHTTWYDVEKGRPTTDDTRIGVCRALDWTDDSFDRLLAGEDPVEQDRSSTRQPEAAPWDQLLEGQRRITEMLEALADRLEDRR